MHYYNEWEKFPAQWLRELAADGLIPEGVVDERSIAELRHEDLAGYNQCHFFAGIGGWPLALRLAGWPEEWPIWTGSCPCQPFSNAGKRKGDSDERHLWPVWFELIRVRKPAAVVGEQVASAISMGWLDRVLDDLEAEGYTTWACVLPACSVGAPHLRARLFWAGVRVALPNGNGWEQRRPECAGQGREPSPVDGGPACGVGNANSSGGEARRLFGCPDLDIKPCPDGDGRWHVGLPYDLCVSSDRLAEIIAEWREDCGLAYAEDPNRWRSGAKDDSRRRTPEAGGCGDSVRRLGDSQQPRLEGHAGDGADWDEPGRIGAGAPGSTPATGHWSDAAPILCRDGKTRRIPAPQSGIFGLAHGLPEGMDLGWAESAFPLAGKVEGRVGLLKGYGNAIVPQVAAAFLREIFG